MPANLKRGFQRVCWVVQLCWVCVFLGVKIYLPWSEGRRAEREAIQSASNFSRWCFDAISPTLSELMSAPLAAQPTLSKVRLRNKTLCAEIVKKDMDEISARPFIREEYGHSLKELGTPDAWFGTDPWSMWWILLPSLAYACVAVTVRGVRPVVAWIIQGFKPGDTKSGSER